MGDNIYLFVPNLIGYARVLLLGAAIYKSFDDFVLFFVFYGLSQLLDALDGYAARWLDQATRYGAVLDMVTDRASTAVLAIVLGKLYSQEVSYGLMAMIAVDIMSHYAILYSSLLRGQASHKDTPQSLHWALRIYYGSRPILFILCAGQEGFLLLMYLHKMLTLTGAAFFVDQEVVRWVMLATLPLFAVKQLMNVIQLKQAATDIGAIDQSMRAERAKKRN